MPRKPRKKGPRKLKSRLSPGAKGRRTKRQRREAKGQTLDGDALDLWLDAEQAALATADAWDGSAAQRHFVAARRRDATDSELALLRQAAGLAHQPETAAVGRSLLEGRAPAAASLAALVALAARLQAARLQIAELAWILAASTAASTAFSVDNQGPYLPVDGRAAPAEEQRPRRLYQPGTCVDWAEVATDLAATLGCATLLIPVSSVVKDIDVDELLREKNVGVAIIHDSTMAYGIVISAAVCRRLESRRGCVASPAMAAAMQWKPKAEAARRSFNLGHMVADGTNHAAGSGREFSFRVDVVSSSGVGLRAAAGHAAWAAQPLQELPPAYRRWRLGEGIGGGARFRCQAVCRLPSLMAGMRLRPAPSAAATIQAAVALYTVSPTSLPRSQASVTADGAGLQAAWDRRVETVVRRRLGCVPGIGDALQASERLAALAAAVPGTHLAPGLYVKKSLASANAKPVHDDDNGTILTCHSVGDASGDTVFVLFVNGKRPGG